MSGKELKPVYLLYGDEFLIGEAIERLKKRLLGEGQTQLDFKMFSGLYHSAQEILQAAETLPYLTEKHLVVVKDFDSLSSTDKEKMADYTENPSQMTCLVLAADKIKKDSRIAQLVQKRGQVYEFKSLRRHEIPNWVREEFSKEGKEISADAIRYLIEKAGSSLRDLKSEIRKVSLFIGDKRKVGREDLELAVSPKPESSIFDLVDSLGHRNRRRALNILNQLLDTGEPPQRVFYMILRQFRLLLKTKGLAGRRESRSVLATELGVPYFLLEKYLEQSANFSLKQLKRIYEMLWQTDLKIKKGEQSSQLALELLIVQILS